MVRAYLSWTLVVLQLVVAQVAHGLPPDRVPNSPIPPLQPPPSRSAPQARAKASVEQGILVPLPPAKPPAAEQRAEVATNDAARGPQDYLTERTELWNSAEMRVARQHVLEFSRRSARTSPEEGQKFLDQLAKLSPEQMQSWLERYRERRLNIVLQRELEQVVRRLMVERALNRQEAMRQAQAHVSQLRAEAAATMQMRMQQGPTRLLQRGEVVTVDTWPVYNPLEAVVDPASPRGYRRRVAAAMSLPGDLPRGDPRNFITGEEGVDFGEWATSRDAEPPVE